MEPSPPFGHASSRSYLTYRRLLYTGGRSIAQITVHEPSRWARRIREEVIQDIWHRQEVEANRFVTTTGERVVVLDPGAPNTDSGPDFTGAIIEIDDLQWFGDVEIHRTPAGWYEHMHDRDPRYNRVVLHVSMYDDHSCEPLRREDRSRIPELVLHPYLSAPVRQLLYRFYVRSKDDIYCRSSWAEVPARLRISWIRRLGLERLRAHKEMYAEDYLTRGDLHAVLYRHIFRALGYAKNDEAMLSLVERIPIDVTQQYCDTPAALDALFLGMSGLLSAGHTRSIFESKSSRYVERLRGYFHDIAAEIDRPPMEPPAWRFFRLRPANFPSLRIAQGAALLQRGRLLQTDSIGQLVQAVQGDKPVRTIRSLLQVPPPEFWNSHVRLERRTRRHDATLGTTRADTIAVNVLLPVLLLYAEQQEDMELRDRIEEVFGEFPAGGDRIVRKFEKMGTKPSSARETQGIHQLYRTRCSKARCLQCTIGRYILEHRGQS